MYDITLMEDSCRKCKNLLSGHLEVVKLLVSHSADVMCKDKCGYTPLHAASASGQLDVVKYLLKLGVEVKLLGQNYYYFYLIHLFVYLFAYFILLTIHICKYLLKDKL